MVHPKPSNWTPLFSIVTLAFQRLRQTWKLLLLVEVGMVVAVTLVCTMVLYSQVAMTAGLRGTISYYSQNGDIVVRSQPRLVSTLAVNQTTLDLDHEFQRNLGSYIAPLQFSLRSQFFTILARSRSGSLQPTGAHISMIGAPTDSASSHVRLLSGRLPQPITSGDLEIALKPDTAEALNVGIGSVLNVNTTLFDGFQASPSQVLTLRVVGIFTLATGDDAFWHGENFAQTMDGYKGLVSNDAILAALARFSENVISHKQVFYSPSNLFWYYSLNTSHLGINDLNTLIQRIQTVKVDIANNKFLERPPYIENTFTYLPSNVLDQYQSRVSIAQIAVISIVSLEFGLVLFFIVMMANLLIERQADAIALLYSRGASHHQVVGALSVQGLMLGLIALGAAPLLALFSASWLAQHTLSASDLGALNIITNDPAKVLLGLSLYALAAVGASVLTMVLTVHAASKRDILAIRRETARSTRIPLWQRLKLDMIAALIALIGYVFSTYLTHSPALDTRLSLLLLSPLTLLQSICLLLAGLLFLLRFQPLLLHIASRVTRPTRGTTPQLALAQMARAPRQSSRMILLLALAGAFAIFTLVFTASQSQRIVDVAAYQTGADFSGAIPIPSLRQQQLADATMLYRHIPGVISASVGFTDQAQAGNSTLTTPIDFKAVDADTFGQTAIWTTQDSSQSLPSLMRQLVAQRSAVLAQGTVPAIIDANAQNQLHLSVGAHFTLNFSNYAEEGGQDLTRFVVIAQVQHIPTPGDSSVAGVLVDYSSFETIYTNNSPSAASLAMPLNYVWLRTRDDAASLASVRQTLNQGDLSLDPLYDRRAMISILSHEPLYLTLIGVLALGAMTALLLALLGSLITSWLSAYRRLRSFATLHALGATLRQVSGVLTCEQGIIYTLAVLLSIACGALFSILVLPSLVFTSVLSSKITGDIPSSTFYAAQSVPPLHLVIPTSLGIALSVLVVTCLLGLVLMVRVVMASSISQVLRLSED